MTAHPIVPASSAAPSDWVQRYGQMHRMQRVTQFPAGIIPPSKVRLYWRNGHWLLQWWDPGQRKNVATRVDGDIVTAITKAREIDQCLIDVKTAGPVSRRLRHADLVERFLKDMQSRAEAGQIDPASVQRYRSALGHYLDFTQTPSIQRTSPYATTANRELALAFAAFLKTRRVHPNGRAGATSRPMKGQSFVWDAARAMFHWARDPERGHLLPASMVNPFRRLPGQRHGIARDPFGAPDITLEMAAAFLAACDAYQLRLFVPLVFLGLRAEEPAYLFHEYISVDWLHVPCNAELLYTTKGKRDKHLPLLEPVYQLLAGAGRQVGLLYLRRSVVEGQEKPPLLGASMDKLAQELQRRIAADPACTAAGRQALRDSVLREAGGIDYDRIEGEFRRIARALNWPKQATLKDFRHLFLTSLANAGLAEPYRQYLAGHALSDAPIMNYTHLDQVRQQYLKAAGLQWPALLEVLEQRIQELGIARIAIKLA